MTYPKPTLPSAKPEVGTAESLEVLARNWYVENTRRYWANEPNEATPGDIIKNMIGFARFYAKSIAAKAAENAASDWFEIEPRLGTNRDFHAELAAIIQKCFDTEIEREQ